MINDHLDISAAGLHRMENEEGKKPWVYDDGDGQPIVAGKILKGRPTFGVGHLICRGEVFPRYPQEASDELIDSTLKKDLAVTISIIKKHVKVPLNQNQFDALVSFVFNVGGPQFLRSTVLRVLNQGRYDLTDDHFLDWRYDDRKRPILLERRKREAALFNTPVESKKLEPKKPEPVAKKAPVISSAKPSKSPKAGLNQPPSKRK